MAPARVEPTPIGFSGTRLGYDGGSDLRERGERGKTMFAWLVYLRARLGRIVGHHGDCLGSDVDFHDQCTALGIPRVLHPPSNPSLRANAHKRDGKLYTISAQNTSTVLSEEPYLDRDWVIVSDTKLLLAAPDGKAERKQSGTWATINMARQAKRWIIIVFPDGTWRDEGERPGWCTIPDDRLIPPDELGHRWDGDHCVVCGFDSTDAMGFGNHPLPTCDEWRGDLCLCRTGGEMICRSCSDGEECMCRVCMVKK